MKNTLLIYFFTFIAITAGAQNDTSLKAKNVFTASFNYQDKLHYFGRVDSLNSSGYFPTIGFETKPGFFGNASVIMVNNAVKPTHYAGTIAQVGYKFPTSRNFSGNLFYNHFFYEKQAEIVQAALKGQTGINLTYNNKIADVTLGGDLKFSDRTDIGATVSVNHLFIYVIPKTSMAVAVNPTATLNAGTQNFTRTYYRKNSVLGLPAGQTLVEERVQRFELLAYELSLPVVFVAGKFNASITAAFVSPQNLLQAPDPAQSEFGKNLFYYTASVGVRL